MVGVPAGKGTIDLPESLVAVVKRQASEKRSINFSDPQQLERRTWPRLENAAGPPGRDRLVIRSDEVGGAGAF